MEKKTLSHACMQLGRDRVCCLYKGSVELPSDMHGIVYIPFKDSVEETRNMIVEELKAAGYEIRI
jgi:predicted nucleotide-binding protein